MVPLLLAYLCYLERFNLNNVHEFGQASEKLIGSLLNSQAIHAVQCCVQLTSGCKLQKSQIRLCLESEVKEKNIYASKYETFQFTVVQLKHTKDT